MMLKAQSAQILKSQASDRDASRPEDLKESLALMLKAGHGQRGGVRGIDHGPGLCLLPQSKQT